MRSKWSEELFGVIKSHINEHMEQHNIYDTVTKTTQKIQTQKNIIKSVSIRLTHSYNFELK